MASATSKIGEIKSLRAFAGSLRGATEWWAEKYADKKHYDKQGFGFTLLDRVTTAAFSFKPVVFDAYVGTYGSSSVGNAWRVDQVLVDRYFVAALNAHKQAIFDSMAAMAEADAGALVGEARRELEAIQAMLAEAVPQPASDAA